MINFSDDLRFCLSGTELYAAFVKCLKRTSEIFSGIVLSKEMSGDFKIFNHIFCGDMTQLKDLESTLVYWLHVTMESRGKRQLDVGKLLPGVDIKRSRMTYSQFKPFVKLFFILMYGEKALLLPYEFERPSTAWMSQVENTYAVWSELIAPFRAIAQVKSVACSRGELRLIQTSSKILMTTDWYTADCINMKELDELYSVYGKGIRGLQTPIPFGAIVNFACSIFPTLVSQDLLSWAEVHSEAVRNRTLANGSVKGRLGDTVKKELSAVLLSPQWQEELKEFLTRNALAGRQFFGRNFKCLEISEELLIVHGCDASASLSLWVEAQEWFIDYKGMESEGAYRTSLGRLNIWLFIYLPVWVSKAPGSSYPVPESPSKFLPLHYMDKRPREDRPMCLTEFYEFMGWTVNRTNMGVYQMFFNEVSLSLLAGCEDVRQPIGVLPTEKAKGEIVKNIFDQDDDECFTQMLETFEALSDVMFESPNLFYLVASARKNNEYFDFESIGLTPIIYFQENLVSLRYVPAQIFFFTLHQGVNYYNPGVVRFCLFLRWSGTRGQNAQWLDADIYGRVASRISMDPMGLDLLYVNTDKIRAYPFTVAVHNRALWLLDRQNEWRIRMVEQYGIEKFRCKVVYERRPNTKWGKVLPIFAADAVTGEPFTDGQYSKVWTMLCLALQSALKEFRIGKQPLVALLPVLKGKEVADWDDWFSGRVAKESIGEFKREGTIAGVYDGLFCRVNLRCFATPHGGGRAGFISDVSNWAPPELGAMFTGQTAGQFTKYNKGRALFAQIEGAFNTKDSAVIQQLSLEMPNMYAIAQDFEMHRRLGATTDSLAGLGFFNGCHQNFSLSIDSLLSDPDQGYLVCATHICLQKFVCPPKVVSEIGQGNCPECPYAIFSVANIVAVTAAVRKAHDEYLTTERFIANRTDIISDFERERISEKLKEFARKVVAWRKVEINLWGIIKLNEHNEYGGFLAGGEQEFYHAVEQYLVVRGSKEDFLECLVHATAYKELVSEDMNLRMDRAARLLMAGQGRVREALTMPTTWSAAEIVASEIRSCMQRYSIDFDHLVSLLNLSESEWRCLMLEMSPDGLEHDVFGVGLIARIKN